MNRFESRAIFITGAGHGIGRETALRLSREGGNVALGDIDGDAATRTAESIVQAGGNAIAITCDVTDTPSVDSAITATVSRFGKLDVLVNVAGGDWDEPAFEELSDDTW